MDSFLIYLIPLSTESERQRNSNPRKVYPADPALIQAFDTSGRANIGHALETIIMNELQRRRAEVGYVKTKEGYEVDFHARFPDRRQLLIQVCSDLSQPKVLERELRALESASEQYPQAERIILVLTREEASQVSAGTISIKPAYEWLLEEHP